MEKNMNKNWYKEGVRLLIMLYRTKDGAKSCSDRNSERFISRNPEEFDRCLEILRQKREDTDIPYRIYSSCNSRNFKKAVRLFKIQQIDADYQNIDQKMDFYINSKNQFYSCLAKTECAQDKRFLIDVDTKDCKEIQEIESELKEITDIFEKRETPNGFHFIVDPYNPSITPELDIKKDGLILL